MEWMSKAGKTVSTFSFILHETIDLGNGPIESDDGKSLVGSIEDDVLAHHGKANEAEITTNKRSRRAEHTGTCTRQKSSIRQQVCVTDAMGLEWTGCVGRDNPSRACDRIGQSVLSASTAGRGRGRGSSSERLAARDRILTQLQYSWFKLRIHDRHGDKNGECRETKSKANCEQKEKRRGQNRTGQKEKKRKIGDRLRMRRESERGELCHSYPQLLPKWRMNGHHRWRAKGRLGGPSRRG